MENKNELAQDRKEKILKILKKDRYLTVFVILAIISFLLSFVSKSDYSLVGFSSSLLLFLGIACSISAVAIYYKKYKLSFYPILAWIVLVAVSIRTNPLKINPQTGKPGLWDIVKDSWTLGPDLDPWLFWRWAGYIVENGKLMLIDTMRYAPLGYETKRELLLHPYLMALFHKIAIFFGSESVTHSSIIYPVFMFALTVIAFFFLTREIFIEKLGERNSGIIALISSLFLAIIPAILPRTIAGIPEKESAAFLFMFLAFYLFLKSWKSEKTTWKAIFAIAAGISTAGMALIWGGYAFIFLTLAPAILIAFLIGKIKRGETYTILIWVVSSFVLMYPFSTRYNLKALATSVNTAPILLVLLIILIHTLLFSTKLKKYFEIEKLRKIPPRLISLIVSIVVVFVLALVLLDPSFVFSFSTKIIDNLVQPATDRLTQTVAENKQLYLVEWIGNFGPSLLGVHTIFWISLIGILYLFYNMLESFDKKSKINLTVAFLIFLSVLVFSRYSSSSILNGENFFSIVFLSIGFILFIGVSLFYYKKIHSQKNEEILKVIRFEYLFLISFFIFTLLSARAAARLVMMMVPPISIIVGYLIVSLYLKKENVKKERKIYFLCAFLVLVVLTLFAIKVFYQTSDGEANNYVPSSYNQQWQRAMGWVRDNTPQNAVFAHWWDYGYWVQSIGERTTVLDGGNAISYWNHLMGRHVLTGVDSFKALEFLYAHNTTHLLIDSTDISKYGAFSFIGSNTSLDRRDYLSIMFKDNSQTTEAKNETKVLYRGGYLLPGDIIYEINGTKIFLPGGEAAVGGVIISRDSEGKINSNPIGIFVYKNNQYNLPLRYIFDSELKDFGSGIEAGAFIFASAEPEGGGVNVDSEGALIYLSERTVKSNLVRLYLYGEKNDYFKLEKSEDDFVIEQLKNSNLGFTQDFVYFQGFRGPIKIWSINYPEQIEFKEEFVQTNYPEELQSA